MKKLLAVTAAGVCVVFAAIVGMVSVVFAAPGGGAGCTVGSASIDAAKAHDPVAGYSGDQLVNAASIINAGAALGVSSQGQIVGVMTAMGESGLRNIEYGDAAGPDSRGLFQQRDTWGTLEQRMNPAQAATFFFERLVKVPNWPSMTPTAAAHAVQRNQEADHYTRWFEPAQAVVSALTGSDTACTAAAAATVSGNAQQLAQHLVDLTNQGAITWLSPSHFPEVQAIAAGQPKPNCGIDTRVLQVITVATQTFRSIGISDINRLCSGQRPGAGDASAHVVNGGGHAVDFYAFDGTPTTGADPNAIKLLRALAPVMPDGSGVGQSDCRASAGTSLDLPMKQFPDTCNHQHVQVDPWGDEPMKLTSKENP
ncbi:hypothetical protein DZF92_01590 [Clavibacter michiganensis subsp. insidiosus]|uniref:Secreted protein n=1 Tax=Clavibacter michiganensis subsp. insidiosus TaxID=33014 RepID=A0A399SQN7_9MICO|nr:hypothetical protein [Clavibacter michiganensis]AWG02927.1 hypothetical protein BEH62_15135 [Clavibacter michiganensis subsp. insidiosus]OQJ56863.1 hypothetical protein B5P21_16265 [Clavibacter michiganensis subsp. insidiosus]RII88829.1 hypothetical protein DZF92_01590 [Clavibacter michiganensis subsp. insidiosus]RIJ44712.1 hypothetical protein DZF93_01790 [Clavibacter michiganensis subsp. insidiosus]RMC82673.1 hypothetical protein CmiCFBP2404_15165 [Clavibacter michiganensis subsp. insidio